MRSPEEVDFEDYYDLLDVPHSASRAEIFEAYEEKIMMHHPDRHSNSGNQEVGNPAEMFKHLQRARDVLCTPKKREKYDRIDHDTYVRQEFSDDPVATHARSDAERARTEGGQPSESSSSGPYAAVEGAGNSYSPERQSADSFALDELLNSDPLEKAWTGWRQLWTLRVLASLFGLGCVALWFSINGSSPLLRYIGPLGVILGIFVLTGGYAYYSYPVRDQVGFPPEGASIGLFRLDRAHKLVRRGVILIAVSGALVVAGALTDPHPWIAFHNIISGPPVTDIWSVQSIVGSSGQVPATGALYLLLIASTVLGTIYAFVGLSAGAWGQFFSNQSQVAPVIWECLGVISIATFGYGILFAPDPAPATFQIAFATQLLGATGGATGATFALLGHGAFLGVNIVYLYYSPQSRNI